MRRLISLSNEFALSMIVAGCAHESSQALVTPQVNSATVAYNGPKTALAVGKFDNRSSFMRGLFSDGVDRLGGQAKTILITHLQQANRFVVMDRDNMKEGEFESTLNGKTQKLKGADFIITGDVTEFGRKETGDRQLFGILGRGKTQVAYSKVSSQRRERRRPRRWSSRCRAPASMRFRTVKLSGSAVRQVMIPP